MSSAPTAEVLHAQVLPAADQVALFHRALAELCRAEMPLPRALEAVAADLGRGPLADAVRAMAADVESGTPLGEAYAAHADGLPALYRGLVEAGIASGDLPGVLDEIAAHASAQAEIAARIRRALAYPIVAASVVVVVGIFLTVTVGPRLDALSEQITDGNGAALFGWQAGGTWTDAVAVSPWFPLVVVLAIAVLGAFIVVTSTALRRPLDGTTGLAARFYKWPVLGRLRAYAALSTLTATLALLIRRRMALAHALQLAAATCDEPTLRARVAQMADDADQGASLADVLTKGGVLAPSLVWIVDSAERRGQAAAALTEVSSIYRDRLSRAADRAALWLTPIAELGVGVLVLLVGMSFLGRLLHMTAEIMGLAGARR